MDDWLGKLQGLYWSDGGLTQDVAVSHTLAHTYADMHTEGI